MITDDKHKHLICPINDMRRYVSSFSLSRNIPKLLENTAAENIFT